MGIEKRDYIFVDRIDCGLVKPTETGLVFECMNYYPVQFVLFVDAAEMVLL